MRFTTSMIILCLFAGAALADKGGNGKGGGGGGGPLQGTLYFRLSGQMYSMDPDGLDKTALPANVSGEPSGELHGDPGFRWFLQLREFAGEVYPNGDPRLDLFAVRDDGDETFTVQLTDDPDLQPLPEPNRQYFLGFARWIAADAQVTWIARRWDAVEGRVTEGGIYAGDMIFDSNGNVAGLVDPPTVPLLPVDLVLESDADPTLRPDLASHDWSPDGNQVAFATLDWLLAIGEVATGTITLLTTKNSCYGPVWSPDGSRIAFMTAVFRQDVVTVRPDGTGEKVIIRSNRRTAMLVPQWSPSGDHLLYQSAGGIFDNGRSDVFRATSSGGGKTNLTADLDTRYGFGTHADPIAWR